MSKRNIEVSGCVEPRLAANLARRAFQEDIDSAREEDFAWLGPR